MNRIIITSIFIVVTYISSLNAMELVELTNLSKKSPSINRYGSLTENTFDIIQEQKQKLSKSVSIHSAHVYLDAVHASLKLDQWYVSFRALPERCKRDVMSTMSTQLLYFHAVALCFPPEIVKCIIFCMLDGEEEAVEQFYALPFIQAFDLYHEIKTGLADDTKPVGPLYAKHQQVRDLVLKIQKSPWYYSRPVVNFENKEEIDLLPGDIKNMYLHDKDILVLPDDEHNGCTPKKLCLGALVTGGIGIVLFGALSAGFASLGACGAGGMSPNVACNSVVLPTNLGLSFGVGGYIFCIEYAGEGCKNLYHYSQEVTI